MKLFKSNTGESRIERNLWIFIFIMIVLIAFCFFTSCSVQQESLLTPNMKDGKISGISRNGKKYTIVDGHGHKNGYMRTETPPDSSKIGTPLICINEFRFK